MIFLVDNWAKQQQNILTFGVVSAAAAALTAETFVWHGVLIQWEMVAFVASATAFGYSIAHISPAIKWIGWGAGCLALTIFWLEKWSFTPVFGLGVALGMAYLLPSRWWSLRELTWGKPIVIATVWLIFTYKMPVFWSNLPENRCSLGYPFERWWLVAALSIAYDLVDVDADRRAGLCTLAVRFGIGFTQYLVVVLLLVSWWWLFSVADGWLLAGIAGLYCMFGWLVFQSFFIKNRYFFAKMVIDLVMVGHFGWAWLMR